MQQSLGNNRLFKPITPGAKHINIYIKCDIGEIRVTTGVSSSEETFHGDETGWKVCA